MVKLSNHFTAKGAVFQVRADPHEGLKSWLHRYKELQTDADRLHDRLDELRSRAESAKIPGLDGMPRSLSYDGDRTGSLLAQIEEAEAEARAAQQEATAARRDLETAIKKISGPRWADRREVLRLRYVDGLRWPDVSERMYGDEADFWDRPEAFLRRVYKLHSSALQELSKFVPLQEEQENGTIMEDIK